MNAQERLHQARVHSCEGRYEEALADLIWFHDNALAERPSLYGVRLSFALSDWVELGEKYPPARAALIAKRDQTVESLLLGQTEVNSFVDVVAINEYLNATQDTYALYLKLMQQQSQFAQECSGYALSAIISAKDYLLAAKLAPDAETEIHKWSKRLNQQINQIKYRRFTPAPVRWAETVNYVEKVEQMLAIKLGLAAQQEAARLKALALSQIESPSLRREVTAAFVKRPNPPKRK